MPSLVTGSQYLVLMLGLGAAILVGVGAFVYAMFRR